MTSCGGRTRLRSRLGSHLSSPQSGRVAATSSSPAPIQYPPAWRAILPDNEVPPGEGDNRKWGQGRRLHTAASHAGVACVVTNQGIFTALRRLRPEVHQKFSREKWRRGRQMAARTEPREELDYSGEVINSGRKTKAPVIGHE